MANLRHRNHEDATCGTTFVTRIAKMRLGRTRHEELGHTCQEGSPEIGATLVPRFLWGPGPRVNLLTEPAANRASLFDLCDLSGLSLCIGIDNKHGYDMTRPPVRQEASGKGTRSMGQESGRCHSGLGSDWGSSNRVGWDRVVWTGSDWMPVHYLTPVLKCNRSVHIVGGILWLSSTSPAHQASAGPEPHCYTYVLIVDIWLSSNHSRLFAKTCMQKADLLHIDQG